MIGLLQSVENRIYHNEQAACRAKNLMNAVGILLQELPALMDAMDKEHDGYNYVLFDYGECKLGTLGKKVVITELMKRGGNFKGPLLEGCLKSKSMIGQITRMLQGKKAVKWPVLWIGGRMRTKADFFQKRNQKRERPPCGSQKRRILPRRGKKGEGYTLPGYIVNRLSLFT